MAISAFRRNSAGAGSANSGELPSRVIKGSEVFVREVAKRNGGASLPEARHQVRKVDVGIVGADEGVAADVDRNGGQVGDEILVDLFGSQRHNLSPRSGRESRGMVQFGLEKYASLRARRDEARCSQWKTAGTIKGVNHDQR